MIIWQLHTSNSVLTDEENWRRYQMANKTSFPYERYETLAEPITVYYPTGQESLARWAFQTIDKAGNLLAKLLALPTPEMEILLVAPADWHLAPHNEPEELGNPHPYWTDATSPPCIVIPLELDPIFGQLEQFAADLLAQYGPAVLPRFLALYRKDYNVLLSEDVTEMLGSAIGPSGIRWLDELTYF